MSYEFDHLSTAVRKARVSLGLSQRELSGISGVQQAQISKFENGAVDLRLSSLVALFRALELELVPEHASPPFSQSFGPHHQRVRLAANFLPGAKLPLIM